MYRKINSLVLLILLLSISFISCHKNTDIGLNLIPEKYVLAPNAKDTFTLKAYTSKDSIVTSGSYHGLLGSYIDPIFGSVNASFVTEMRPFELYSKANNPILDSVVLYLKYDTVPFSKYGKENVPMEIKVYRIDKRLSLTNNYYSNFNSDSLYLQQPFLGSSSFVPSNVFAKPLIVKTDTIKNLLPIKLSNNMFEWFLKDTSWESTTFADIFKGLYFTSNSTAIDGSISSFDLASSNSKITLYYRTSDDTLKHTLNFVFNNQSTNFNIYEHQYNSTILSNLGNQESSVIYLEGAGGLKARIKFPHLDEIHEKGTWIVNNAKLMIQAEPTSDASLYPVPSQLKLLSVNSDGTLAYLEDFNYRNTSGVLQGYLGVNYNNGNYIFDITYFVQQIVNGKKPNTDLILMLSNGAYNPARVVLKSPNNSEKMKLIVSLTKVN